MSWFEAVVLGVVQGLTEFLPISSTGHLRIVPALAGWEDPGAAFTAIIQLGTMAAVLIYFRKDLVGIATTWVRSLTDKSLRKELDARMGWYLIIATVPISIFGLLFKDQIETSARSLYLIGAMLIGLGLVLQAAESFAKHRRKFESVETKDAVIVGLAQALALIPGVSRSGSTLTAGLFLGLERAAAARFSFLLSVPAIVLSGGFEAYQYFTGSAGETSAGVGAIVIATLTAFVSGYLAIAWLLKFLSNHSVEIFVIYRVALGTLVIVLAASGTIS